MFTYQSNHHDPSKRTHLFLKQGTDGKFDGLTKYCYF